MNKFVIRKSNVLLESSAGILANVIATIGWQAVTILVLTAGGDQGLTRFGQKAPKLIGKLPVSDHAIGNNTFPKQPLPKRENHAF